MFDRPFFRDQHGDRHEKISNLAATVKLVAVTPGVSQSQSVYLRCEFDILNCEAPQLIGHTIYEFLVMTPQAEWRHRDWLTHIWAPLIEGARNEFHVKLNVEVYHGDERYRIVRFGPPVTGGASLAEEPFTI